MTTAKEIATIAAAAAEFAHDLAGQAAEEVARQEMGLRTLEAQNTDAADFKELAVWTIRKALEAAYDAGVETALQAAEQHVEHILDAANPKTETEEAADAERELFIAAEAAGEAEGFARQAAEDSATAEEAIKAATESLKAAQEANAAAERAAQEAKRVAPNEQAAEFAEDAADHAKRARKAAAEAAATAAGWHA